DRDPYLFQFSLNFAPCVSLRCYSNLPACGEFHGPEYRYRRLGLENLQAAGESWYAKEAGRRAWLFNRRAKKTLPSLPLGLRRQIKSGGVNNGIGHRHEGRVVM